ncbi:MAG: hypothetical protein J6L99_03790 [Ruminococcus sp.]|nr:hypothetical protein [Ruminococcus sp.]
MYYTLVFRNENDKNIYNELQAASTQNAAIAAIPIFIKTINQEKLRPDPDGHWAVIWDSRGDTVAVLKYSHRRKLWNWCKYYE